MLTDPIHDCECMMTRRQFFGRTSTGIGIAALGAMLGTPGVVYGGMPDPSLHGALKEFHFPPRAKRVIYLFQSGGPSQLDLFDYKPNMKGFAGQELPDSVRMGQRI